MKFNAVVLMIVAFTFAGFGQAQHGDHGPAPAGTAHQASGKVTTIDRAAGLIMDATDINRVE